MGSSSVGMFKGGGEYPDPFKLYAEAYCRPWLKFDNDDPQHLNQLHRDCTEKLSDSIAKSKECFAVAMKLLDEGAVEGLDANLRQAQHFAWIALENLELENNICRVKKSLNDDKKTQFQWLSSMSRELLTFLAGEVKKGNRPNNTFKPISFVAAGEFISMKFNVKCLPEHIDNHLKTMETTWGVISKLRNKDSGFGWDDNLKMILASPTTYDAYIEANPTHDKYLNKKIESYDEMEIIFGEDVVGGNGAKSFANIEVQSQDDNVMNLEEKDDDESEMVKDNKHLASSCGLPSESKKS